MSAFKKLSICPFSKFMAMLGHGVTQHTLIDCKPSTDISKIQPTTWGDGCLADAGFERERISRIRHSPIQTLPKP